MRVPSFQDELIKCKFVNFKPFCTTAYDAMATQDTMKPTFKIALLSLITFYLIIECQRL